MLNIVKSKPPNSLVAYAKTRGAYYGGQTPEVTRELRSSLLAEQGYLCCYCMGRIRDEKLKVEHWRSQSRYPQFQLAYDNLLAVCDGNPGKRRSEQTCDARKRDSDLRFNPADTHHDVENKIAYRPNGEIYAPDDQFFDDQLNKVLNLNQPTLINNRKAAIDAVKRRLGVKPGPRSRREIDSLIRSIRTPDKQGCLEAFSGVAVFFLKKKLKSAPN